jgi:hypothetical protein
MVTDPRWPGGGEFRGQVAFRRFMDQFLEAFAGIRFQEEREPEVLADAALFNGRWIGMGVSSRIETASVPFWVLHRSRNGLITESRFFFDEAEAREAA